MHGPICQQAGATYGGRDLKVQLVCDLLAQGLCQLGCEGLLEGLEVLEAGRAHGAVQLQHIQMWMQW